MRRRAFTLVELLIVLVILAIVAALAMPMAGTISTTRVIAAARLLTADLEYAQQASIADPSDPCVVKVDVDADQYWIARASDVDTAIDNPAGPGTMLVSFGSGRAHTLEGVTVQSADFDGDDELHFDGFGLPDQTTAATVVLSADGFALTVSVDPATGEVSVQ